MSFLIRVLTLDSVYLCLVNKVDRFFAVFEGFSELSGLDQLSTQGDGDAQLLSCLFDRQPSVVHLS